MSFAEDESKQSTHKKLLVQGLPEGLNESYIELFFEDEKKSGGGEIQSVEIIGNSAVIDFKEPGCELALFTRYQIHIVSDCF